MNRIQKELEERDVANLKEHDSFVEHELEIKPSIGSNITNDELNDRYESGHSADKNIDTAITNYDNTYGEFKAGKFN